MTEPDAPAVPPTPCLLCQRALNSVGFGSRELNQPAEAVTFTAHGQYGSTMFDPMDGTKLQVNICDSCLRVAARQQLVYLIHTDRMIETVTPGFKRPTMVGVQTIETKYSMYDPDAEHENRALLVPLDKVGSPDFPDTSWSPGLENGWPDT